MLVVHHRNYTADMPWDEPPENLETLCKECHDKEHANGDSLFNLRKLVAEAHRRSEWDRLWMFAHYVANDSAANDNGMGGI
jgi:5-methylcytosine-specific restriction endonuclease McrA